MDATQLATPDNGADKTITIAISGNRLVAILNALDALMHRAGRYTIGHNSTEAVEPYDAAILESTEAIRDELSRQRCTHDAPYTAMQDGAQVYLTHTATGLTMTWSALFAVKDGDYRAAQRAREVFEADMKTGGLSYTWEHTEAPAHRVPGWIVSMGLPRS